MRYRWKVNPPSDRVGLLGEKYKLNPIIVQILLNRGIPEDEFLTFLYPSRKHFHSPTLLPDIEKATERIRYALHNREGICLFGDYDVDGVTSLSIFYDFIKDFDNQVSIYIPHRLKEGYGLNKDAIKRVNEDGARLLICFDCGTNAYEEIDFASSLGMDTIIIDHHHPKDDFQIAGAFVNPKRKDSRYPFRDLSTAAITFKLVQILKDDDCEHLLDLVVLSLVCDVVPLKGENRTLLKEGLPLLRRSTRPALRALCKSSGVKMDNLDTFHLGYILGPRINASGRINTAQEALKMFLTDKYSLAEEIASRLEEYNIQRRDIERRVLQEAEEYLKREAEDRAAVVVYEQGWHPGILGIVASRLADKYYRPAFVIGFDGEVGRGSARSVPPLNIIDALQQCEDYLVTYGGHRKAAGVEILYKDIEKFKDHLDRVVKSMVSPDELVPVIDVDCEIDFSSVTWDLAEDIEKLRPFGEANPPPLFLTRNVYCKHPSRKVSKSMYSVWLTDGKGVQEGIFFEKDGFGDIFNYGKTFDIIYRIEKNNYHNTTRVVLKDVRFA